ncbi:hypothetical protein [Kribbella speibonae]|uniref:Uncharacterized protein n=1 Tax=Kribbella speibonae TaxID=1572660 RepID=A0A4R0IUA2_9ACTN|nr:hypothetical protein [Kribbella speibonae]TCC36330.1 hypothetical protein E0H92_27145 [Kribbella speibonae]
MTIVGVSGHQRLPAIAVALAERELRLLFADLDGPLIGLSSLAIGADQLFAQLILDTGGELHAVIPAVGFEKTFDDNARSSYFALLSKATQVTTLDYPMPSEEAYDAAGRFVVDHCDLLFAVWDGKPARGPGGTADAVGYARELHRRVQVSWPPNAERD